MKIDIEFDKLKETILLAAQVQGLSKDELLNNWCINYKRNQDEKFKSTLEKLDENIKLLHQSLEQKDMLVAKVAIVRAKVYSHDLMNFFENINDDIDQLGWGDELKDKWPTIPEDYRVPDHYDYADANKPYE
ncbi:hypothetical protein RHO14_07855 [Orbus wheelerorum]|uniref:hypothetical protein n=1 Tax=Orbus wheelerorum TaxID=3074111 RepID=UPI00370DB47C